MKTIVRAGIVVFALFFSGDLMAQGFLKKISNALDQVNEILGTEPASSEPASTAKSPEPAQAAPAAATPVAAQVDEVPLITAAGAGVFKFGAIKTGQVGKYTVSPPDEDYEGVRFVEIKDADGNLAITYYPDYLMTVRSSDFRTEKGVRVGMTLTEVRSKMGAWSPVLEQYDIYRAYLFPYSSTIFLAVYVDDLKDGGAAWDEAWAKGTAYSPKLGDFKPEAKVYEIVIRK